MLLSAFIVISFMFVNGLRRYVPHAVIAAVGIVGLFFVYPETVDMIYEQYVLKGSEESVAFENSRGAAYDISYNSAVSGGVFGVGNGISTGADPAGYEGGFSSVGYGREKGSSVLAIVEEIGLVGLIITTLFVITLLISALKIQKYLGGRTPIRVALLMMVGLFIGMAVHCNFEAWWVSPGSAESVFFWGVSGILFGIVSQIQSARISSTTQVR